MPNTEKEAKYYIETNGVKEEFVIYKKKYNNKIAMKFLNLKREDKLEHSDSMSDVSDIDLEKEEVNVNKTVTDRK